MPIDEPPAASHPAPAAFRPALILRALAFAGVVCATVAFTSLFSALVPASPMHAAAGRPEAERAIAVRDTAGWAADESASGTRPDASH